MNGPPKTPSSKRKLYRTQVKGELPISNLTGTDLIVITVNDEDLQGTFITTIQVDPVADDPTAVDDAFTIDASEGEAVALNVLYNDSNLPDVNNSVGLSIISDSLTTPTGHWSSR